MDQVHTWLPFVWCYINDVIISSNSPQEYVRHLQVVFERLRTLGLTLTPWKMQILPRLPILYATYDCIWRTWGTTSEGGRFAKDPNT